MTLEHAQQWMSLLRRVLQHKLRNHSDAVQDALEFFLRTSMRKYGGEFDFNGDEAMCIKKKTKKATEKDHKMDDRIRDDDDADFESVDSDVNESE